MQGNGAYEKSPPKLTLASKSYTRQLILKEMGFELHIIPAEIDEKAIGDRLSDRPEELVLEIGRAKARAVLDAARREGKSEYLLAGDQVVVHKSKILEKPANKIEAEDFIRSYSNNVCKTVGSVILVDISSGKMVEGVDCAEVHFKDIPDQIVHALVNDEMCLNCAGGLMVEHPLIQQYIDRVDGTIDSVMGLSKELVLRLLRGLQSH